MILHVCLIDYHNKIRILEKINPNILFSEFDELSKSILLFNIEPIMISMNGSLSVDEFVKRMKYALLTGYIIRQVIDMTYLQTIPEKFN